MFFKLASKQNFFLNRVFIHVACKHQQNRLDTSVDSSNCKAQYGLFAILCTKVDSTLLDIISTLETVYCALPVSLQPVSVLALNYVQITTGHSSTLLCYKLLKLSSLVSSLDMTLKVHISSDYLLLIQK
jgi:hypothetical protein